MLAREAVWGSPPPPGRVWWWWFAGPRLFKAGPRRVLRAALSFSGESAAGTLGARDSGEPGPWHRRGLRQPARRRKRCGGSAGLLPRFVVVPLGTARGLITVAGSVVHTAAARSSSSSLLSPSLPLTTDPAAGLQCAGGLCVCTCWRARPDSQTSLRALRARVHCAHSCDARDDPVVVAAATSPRLYSITLVTVGQRVQAFQSCQLGKDGSR